MNQSKVHSSESSKGSVPFAWENKPGICKAGRDDGDSRMNTDQQFVIKLRPPPCPVEKGRPSVNDSSIPLPPCTFQGPSLRNSSRKGHTRKQEDPFLAAYKECTKSTSKGHEGKRRSGKFNLSCKTSCDVLADSLVSKSWLAGLGSRVDHMEGRGMDGDRKWLNP